MLEAMDAFASTASAPLALVPSSSVFVARVRCRDVVNDAALSRMIRMSDIESMTRLLNIKIGDVSEMVIFSDLDDLTSPNVGMILQGPFNIRAILNYFDAQGYPRHTRRNYRLYEGSGLWIAPLKSGLIVMGTRPTVEKVIDVESRPQRGLSANPLLRRLDAYLRSNSSISTLLALPQTYQQAGDIVVKAISLALDFTGLGLLGKVIDKIGLARGLGFSIARKGDTFPVEMVAIMKDATAAGLVSGGFSLLKSAAEFALANSRARSNQEEIEMYKSLSVSAIGADLLIKFSLREKNLYR
jgi:hypothetical protein